MAISKFVLNGTTLMDVTQDTVTPDTLLQNETALAANGELITGEYIEPSGTITITENGDDIDVSKYEFADVHIEGEDLTKALIEGTITSCSDSSITTIKEYAFAGCSTLSYVSFPKITRIETKAFADCINLKEVSFSLCRQVSSGIFQNCENLVSAYLPSCSYLSNYMFDGCKNLKDLTLNWSSISTVSGSAFRSCHELETISIPNAKTIGNGAFYDCSALRSMILPSCSSIAGQAFKGCEKLSVIYLPCYNGTIEFSIFASCYNLLSVYLLGSRVCGFGINAASLTAFELTPISDYTESTGGVHGSIFVRASLYSSYITSTNWVKYSSRIVSMTDEEIAALDF